MRPIALPILAFACAMVAVSCQRTPGMLPVDFVTQIKPILESRCVTCHNSGALFGDLNLETHALALRQRPTGPVIVPREPEQSRLYLVLTLPEGERKAMPPTGHRIPAGEVALIKRWISQGAQWPAGPEGQIKPLDTGLTPDRRGA